MVISLSVHGSLLATKLTLGVPLVTVIVCAACVAAVPLTTAPLALGYATVLLVTVKV